ncbi:MAG: hypothetical protein PHP85_00835 [Gallionella sp.]|nr:hypothetical protein [Gallionella sp.]
MKKYIEKYILITVLMAIVAFSWMKPLDVTAERQIDDGFKRAVASFAVARVLNGVISVAQGTEISISLGVGATLTPGQILDPVNDLVEQFSELMLIASVAFGVMKILLNIGSFWVFSALLSAVALAWAGFKVTGRMPPVLLTKILLVFIFMRFSVPLVAVGNDIVFKLFLEDKFNKSQIAIESSKMKLVPMSSPAVTSPASLAAPPQPVTLQSAQNNGLLGRAKGVFESASQAVASLPQAVENKIDQVRQKYDPKPYIDNLVKQAANLVNDIIDLIVVFVLQTIVIPLGLMWLLYRSCLALIGSAGRRPESN